MAKRIQDPLSGVRTMKFHPSGHSQKNNQTIKVGVVGLGRSGFNIHCKATSQLPEMFDLVAVTDPDPDRRREASDTFGVETHEDFGQLIDDDELDLIVIASPNLMHEDQACMAMTVGKHVVVEKPMALSLCGADRMIDCARDTNRLLIPFQNRRYEAHLIKLREILDSGLLGRIIQIRIEWSFFTRRWDWQTLRSLGGGSLHNHGAHLLDQALLLYGDDQPGVFINAQRALSVGDAEDHVKIVLYGEGKPTIDIESSSCCAYPEDRWHVWGTAGGLRGNMEHLEWRWVDWSTMPDREVSAGPAENRVYQREEYDWSFGTWEQPAEQPNTASLFYHDLYRAIRHGQPHPITPESVRRQMGVLDLCHAQMPV